MREFLAVLLLVNASLLGALAAHRKLTPQQPLFSAIPAKVELKTLPTASQDDLVQYLIKGGAVFVDARPQEVYAKGHIPSSINLPAGEDIPDYYRDQLKSAEKVIVYCGGESCEDSVKLGNILVMEGIKGVTVYEGGFSEWSAAGQPVMTVGESLQRRRERQENASKS